MKKDLIAIALYRIIILFTVFDGLRDNLVISSYISPIKEVSVLLLIMYILIKDKMIILFPKNIISINFAFFFMVVLISSPFIFFNHQYDVPYVTSSYSMYYKMIQFFLLFYVFINYERITNEKYENLLKFFIILLIIFSIITPLIYYSNPWFMVDGFKQWGRINIGYPTMDAENLIVGLILLLFIFEKQFIMAIGLLLIILLAIFMQNTGTGYVSLLFVLIYYIFSNKKYKKNRISFLYMIILISIILIVILLLNSEAITLQIELFYRKIDAILDPANSISINIRKEQFLSLVNYLDDWFYNLYGIGFNIYLENQYDYFRIGMGLIGYVSFVLFLVFNIGYGFIIRHMDNSMLLLSSLLFAMTSYSLITLYLFPTEALYTMMIGYSVHLHQRRKFNENCY